MAGSITKTDLNFQGTGYAVGDTGYVLAGGDDATYIIDSIGAGGTVSTYTITNGGSGYSVTSEIGTHTGGAHPGAGSGFIVDILSVSGGGPANRNRFYSAPA